MLKLRIATIAFAVLGATAAIAGPVDDRQKLMKSLQGATKEGVALARGTVPFDAAKAKLLLDVYSDASARLPGLFPKGSGPESGSKTAADPKIWSDNAGFAAIAAKLGTDAKAARAATDTASFNQAFSEISKSCSACHGQYRLKQN